MYLLHVQRLGSRKPIQNIRFQKWVTVGLCTMSPGRENMLSSIRSPSPAYSTHESPTVLLEVGE